MRKDIWIFWRMEAEKVDKCRTGRSGKADALLVSQKVGYEDVWDLRNAGDLLESRVVQEKD